MGKTEQQRLPVGPHRAIRMEEVRAAPVRPPPSDPLTDSDGTVQQRQRHPRGKEGMRPLRVMRSVETAMVDA